ncbi:hypothetical protein [Mycobacterium avium]
MALAVLRVPLRPSRVRRSRRALPVVVAGLALPEVWLAAVG